MGNTRARLRHELMEAIPPFLYFFAAFHLLAVVRTLMQQEFGIQAGTVMNATIGALIVAKVVLLADYLMPIVNRFPDKPLVSSVHYRRSQGLISSSSIPWKSRVLRVASRPRLASVIAAIMPSGADNTAPDSDALPIKSP
jgi:hypothetical protein